MATQQKKSPFVAAAAESKTYDFSVYTAGYFLKGALAGGICCSLTHGGACPIDVVKTRIQLDPVTYNSGLIGGMKQVIATEGGGALWTGVGATAMGYFVQGWFKFGGYELLKVNLTKSYGDQGAWDNRAMLSAVASGGAEFVADIFLCPLEATRIRQVGDPEMAALSLPGAAGAIVAKDGILGGFYSGFIPILCKQIPYTISKFVVQDAAQEKMMNMICKTSDDRKAMGRGGKLAVSLTSGVIAGVAAAIISHPADTLLSKINKAGAGGEGSMFVRLGRIAGELGVVKLCLTGLPARCVMIGSITAGQFGIFDSLLPAMGVEKFHFHAPH
jgi:solute carrier family 25 phosphate transporter 3